VHLCDVKVVVEFEVSGPEAHKPVDDAVHASDDCWVQVVELVAAYSFHAVRVALEKCFGQ
jgi:hypothetical protein